MVSRDVERQAHSDGAAFLCGYLLGLPCFCFQPDVTESLKLLTGSPQTLNVYKQPMAKLISDAKLNKNEKASSTIEQDDDIVTKMVKSFTSVASSSQASLDIKTIENQRLSSVQQKQLQTLSQKVISDNLSEDPNMFALSRVLIWLMAPVAAETLKYGTFLKCIVCPISCLYDICT